MSHRKRILYLTLTLILLLTPFISVSAQTSRSSQLLNVITSLQNLLASLQSELNSLSSNTQLAQVAPTANLVAHYTFDDQANPARDDSGNNNTGTLTPAAPNGPTWVTGSNAKVGNGALSFDGVNDYVLTPSMAYNSIYSISFWMKTTATASQKLFGWSFWRWCTINSPSANKITCLGTGDSSFKVTSNNAVNEGLWHHAVFTVDSSNNQILYIDGQYQTTNTHTQAGSSGKIYIGSGFLGGSYFNGSLDDVRIYNRALSAGEIQQLYNMGR